MAEDVKAELIMEEGKSAVTDGKRVDVRGSTIYFEANTIGVVHVHMPREGGAAGGSTDFQPASKETQTEPGDSASEEGETEPGTQKIFDDTYMYVNEPLKEGAIIFKGFQKHVSEKPEYDNKVPVAIKEILGCKQRHCREVDLLTKLACHDNVVRIIRSGIKKVGYKDVLYIVMELCGPQNLQDYWDGNKADARFDHKMAKLFSRQLINGLRHIHAGGIIHRDIKPENILLAADLENVKWCDFGLGKILSKGRSWTRVTAKGQGTRGYMAPEVHSVEDIRKAADIFSFGIVLFGLWSGGEHPFGKNGVDQDYNILRNVEPDFTGLHLIGSERKDFLDLMGKMLQYDPKLRPSIESVYNHPFFKHDLDLR